MKLYDDVHLYKKWIINPFYVSDSVESVCIQTAAFPLRRLTTNNVTWINQGPFQFLKALVIKMSPYMNVFCCTRLVTLPCFFKSAYIHPKLENLKKKRNKQVEVKGQIK